MRLFAIPASPSTLLIIILNALTETKMYHESHISLINAHSKGNSGYNNLNIFIHPIILYLCSFGVIH